ncbi:MAG: hypothetical protein IH586_17785, partial [Anaerolineaceae bacterium]|nr:hypothetical protein [Anaerolineaceae bacterium]
RISDQEEVRFHPSNEGGCSAQAAWVVPTGWCFSSSAERLESLLLAVLLALAGLILIYRRGR